MSHSDRIGYSCMSVTYYTLSLITHAVLTNEYINVNLLECGCEEYLNLSGTWHLCS